MDHKLLLAGEWVETGDWEEVLSPWDRSPIARVAQGDADTVDRAVRAAHKVFTESPIPQYERADILDRAAHLIRERQEDLAQTISAEAGKPIKTARVEASRAADTMTFSAVRPKRPAAPFRWKPPRPGLASSASCCGSHSVWSARSAPSTFPNLVCHKLGPAIAAGNAVVLKPAGQTPVSSIKLAEVLIDAGLPAGWLSAIPGGGSSVGNAIVEHDLTAAISFTGSAPVGWGIRSKIPHKKVGLELGSNAPLIVNEDGDWETAADKAHDAFSHAGQVLHLNSADPRSRGGCRSVHRAAGRQCREAEGRGSVA